MSERNTSIQDYGIRALHSAELHSIALIKDTTPKCIGSEPLTSTTAKKRIFFNESKVTAKLRYGMRRETSAFIDREKTPTYWAGMEAVVQTTKRVKMGDEL